MLAVPFPIRTTVKFTASAPSGAHIGSDALLHALCVCACVCVCWFQSTVLLGVMPVHGCHILDLGCLTQSAPPVHNETQTMCHECKKPFTFLDRKHHCRSTAKRTNERGRTAAASGGHFTSRDSSLISARRRPCCLTLSLFISRHCGNTFCNADSSKRIAIPKYGFHSRVRVCDGCYESVAAELESSEVVIKLLELTGEKPEGAEILKASGPAIAAHAQAMEQLKSRGSLTPSAHNKRSSFFKGGGWGGGLLPIDEKKRFTLPTVNKPHLFALKNSERELWLHAENTETRLEWVQAIRSIQKRKSLMGGARGGAANAEAAAALPGGPGAAASSSEALVPALPPKPAGPSWEIDFHAITVLNKVGVGAFGEVFRARLWGTEVAMKTLKTEQFKDEAALVEDLKKEVSILSQLRHPNVVLYIGACTIPPNVCIMTEWCSRGSLYDVLHDYSIHLNAKLVIDLAMGIAQGMNYLHSLENKIIHRDLKSHNILVNKTFQVKVADFGLSHVRELQAKESADGNAAGAVVHKGPRHYGIFGTPEWMAPEVSSERRACVRVCLCCDANRSPRPLSALFSLFCCVAAVVCCVCAGDGGQCVHGEDRRLLVWNSGLFLLPNAALGRSCAHWAAFWLSRPTDFCVTASVCLVFASAQLSELVTRSMPFHDLFKITSYMDVVDAVLDQGAIPTIPNWCENLLGGLIQACVSRIPAERPNFTDLILRLREVAELDDSIYFFQFDLPRLRELMRSSNPAIQSLAASEVAVLLTQPHIRRRSSPGELADGESPDPLATPMPAASPAGHSSLSSSPGGGPLSIVGSPTSPLRLPSPAPGTGTQSHLLSPPSASASSSPPVRRSSNDNNSVSGLGSPLATGSGFAATPSNGSGTGGQQRSPHIDGDTWILDNDDAFDFLERFTALLSSSHREVQLNSCNALISLLRLSHGDKSKRAQDRELIIQNGGLASLLTLLLSEQLSLSTSAGSVLLLLTEDLTSEEQKTFTGLNTQGLTHLQSLILSDIDRDSRALQEIQRKIIHKKRVLEVIQSCAARGAADASAAGGSPALKRPTSSVRGKRSVMLPKFVTNPNSGSGGSSQHLGLGLQAAAPEEDSDDDSDRTISRHLVAHTAAAQAAATADEWDNPGGGRGRAETAQPQTLSPPHNDSPALQALFAKLQELLVKSAALPEKFSDWYSNSIAHGYALRYELEGDSWSLCFIVLLPDELRLFHDARDEPDEPLLILRTKVAPPPEFDDPSPIPAKVRVGPKHGLSHCFQIEDCGRIFTFCAGDQTQQERWRFLITGQPKPGTTATTAAVPAGAAAGQSLAPNRPVPRPSMAPSQVHGGSTMGQFAANPLPVAYSSSVLGGVDVSAGAAPTTAASSAADSGANPALVAMSPRQVAEPDPTIGRDMPQLELPTPPFAKRYVKQ